VIAVSLKGHVRELVLGIALVVIVLWYVTPAPPPDLAAPVEEAAPGGDPVVEVIRRLREIGSPVAAGARGDYKGGGRNLFDYGVIVPPPPTPEELARMEEERRRREEEERQRREEAERLRQEALERQREEARKAAERAAREPPPPPPKPVPPAIDVTFIGVIGEPENKIAIFLDGKDYLLAKEGEVVKGKFRVQKISYDTLQMGFTDPRFASENRILPMGG
jgi:hypothetical protein